MLWTTCLSKETREGFELNEQKRGESGALFRQTAISLIVLSELGREQ